ncbi:MAG: hypothetical protein ACPGWR_29685 [Ardenticatenaceae bacterium]
MKRILYFLLALALLTSGLLVSSTKANGEEDFAIPNGHFYTQTANGEGGFGVVDDEEARFWSEFQRLGGLQTVGYPISRRYVYDGFVTQAFQKLLLQWRPEVGQAWPVNVFDELSDNGFDDRLLSTRQTPSPLTDFDPPNASWEEIVAARQGLLDDNPAIHERYFSLPDSLNVFGLPTSRVEDMDNHYAVRTQRAVFQQWKEDVPWASAGEVTIANGGDIAKEMGWLSGSALEPEAVPEAAHPLEGYGPISTYRNEHVGFEIDYPPSWHVADPSPEIQETAKIYAIVFSSWVPEGPGQDGIPDGSSKMDLYVMRSGANTLQEAVEQRKKSLQSSGDIAILSSEPLTLNGGLNAERWITQSNFGQSESTITVINGYTIVLGGLGDQELIEQIIRTLRVIDVAP